VVNVQIIGDKVLEFNDVVQVKKALGLPKKDMSK